MRMTPNPAARVVAFPLHSSPWRSNSPVYFGRVVRDGGETVELLINPDNPVEAFHANWTATHELSHMMLPYVRRQQRWLSEGFAQYYQNLLLARAGRYTEQEAWRRLYEGFERGRSSVPGLSPNQAAGGGERNSVRFGHPSGTLRVGAEASETNGVWSVDKAMMSRSARVLMEGWVRVPGDAF